MCKDILEQTKIRERAALSIASPSLHHGLWLRIATQYITITIIINKRGKAHTAGVAARTSKADTSQISGRLHVLEQVAHEEDRRNFSGGSEDRHPAGRNNKRYVSTGLFKDF